MANFFATPAGRALLGATSDVVRNVIPVPVVRDIAAAAVTIPSTVAVIREQEKQAAKSLAPARTPFRLQDRFTVARPLGAPAVNALVAASGAPALLNRGGSISSSLLPTLPTITAVGRAALPVLRTIGEGILSGVAGAVTQRALEKRNGMAIGGLSGGGLLPQLRPPRSQFVGPLQFYGRRRRTMNVCNAKALSRALRRLEGFEKIAKRYLKVMGTGKTTAGFKKKRCK